MLCQTFERRQSAAMHSSDNEGRRSASRDGSTADVTCQSNIGSYAALSATGGHQDCRSARVGVADGARKGRRGGPLAWLDRAAEEPFSGAVAAHGHLGEVGIAEAVAAGIGLRMIGAEL